MEEYGGGVYGTGAGITLLVLSVASLKEEWARADGLLDFLRGMTLEFWMGFSGEASATPSRRGCGPSTGTRNHGLAAALAVGAAAWAGDALADAWRRREPLEDGAAMEGETGIEAGAASLS